MNLLWTVGGAKEALYVARITQILQRDHGVNVTLLSAFGSSKASLNQAGLPCWGLHDIWEQAAADLPAAPAEQIQAANDLLSGVDVNLFLHGDPLLYLLEDRQSAQVFIARTALALSKFVRAGSFDISVHYGGELIGRILAALVEFASLPVYTLASGVTWDRFVLLRSGIGEQWTWEAFSASWDTWNNRSIPEAEKERIDKQIAAWLEAHQKRPRTRAQQFGQLRRSRFRRLARRLLNSIRSSPISPQTIGTSLLTRADLDCSVPLWERYVSQLQSSWLETYPKFPYDNVPDRYIYMPLNQPWDAPHRQWNPMNYLQTYVATVAHASLPAGYELVIKEHPYTYGDPSHAKLGELQRLGIRIVEPHIHSHELIRNAAAVFCVGDTTGWEAILFQVPAVVYGAAPFYTAYPAVRVVHDPNQVHHALREAVRLGRAAYQDKEQRYAFLFSALESCYPGNIWAYKGLLWSDPDASEENVRHIATMIAREAISSCRDGHL